MNRNPEGGASSPEEIKEPKPEQIRPEAQPPTPRPEIEKTETERKKFETSLLESLRQATLKNFAPHPSLKEKHDKERRPFVEKAQSVIPRLELNENSQEEPLFYFTLVHKDEKGEEVQFIPRNERGWLDSDAIWEAFSKASRDCSPQIAKEFYEASLQEAMAPTKEKIEELGRQVADFESKIERTKNQSNKDKLKAKLSEAKTKRDNLSVKLAAARLKYQRERPFENKKPHEEADQETLLETIKKLPPEVTISQAVEKSLETTVEPNNIEIIPPTKQPTEAKQEKSSVVIDVVPERKNEEVIPTKRNPEEIDKEIDAEIKNLDAELAGGNLTIEKFKETSLKIAALHREKGEIELAEKLEKEVSEINEETYKALVESLKQPEGPPPPEKPPLTYPDSGGENNEGWWNRVPPKVKKYAKIGVIAGGVGAGIGVGFYATTGVGVGLSTGLALGVSGTLGLGALPFIFWYLLKGWGKLFNWSWKQITGDKFYEGKKKD